MYTVILHTIKEEQYDDLQLALDAIKAECSLTDNQYCSNITVAFTSEDNSTTSNDWAWFSVLPMPPDGNININHGNIKVKMTSN